MSIVNRLKQMVRADANAVLDNIEDPESLLKQSLRDMSQSLSEQEKYLAKLEHQKTVLLKDIDQQESSLVDIQHELELCLDEQNESLARHVVKRKLQASRILQQMQLRLDQLIACQKIKQAEFAERKMTFEALEQQAKVVAAAANDSSSFNHDPAQSPFSVSEEDIDIALLKEKQMRGAS